MTSLEIIKDVVENKKSGILKIEEYIFLFRDGKLLEVAGKTTNREKALEDVIQNNYKNSEFQEVEATVLISFQEPLDISDKLPKKAKRKVLLDEILVKKLQDIKLIVPSLNRAIVGKLNAEVIAYLNINEDELDGIIEKVEKVYEKFPEINDLILNTQDSSIYIRIKNQNYIFCELKSIENIGILRAYISKVLV